MRDPACAACHVCGTWWRLVVAKATRLLALVFVVLSIAKVLLGRSRHIFRVRIQLAIKRTKAWDVVVFASRRRRRQWAGGSGAAQGSRLTGKASWVLRSLLRMVIRDAVRERIVVKRSAQGDAQGPGRTAGAEGVNGRDRDRRGRHGRAPRRRRSRPGRWAGMPGAPLPGSALPGR